MRYLTIALLLSLLGCTTAPLDFQWDDTTPSQAAAQRLRQPIAVLWEDARLADAFDDLRDRLDVNFYINWRALEAAGIEKVTPVSLTLGATPADRVLRLLMQQCNSIANLEPLDFGLSDGIVMISTKRDLQRHTDTRIYDVRDLVPPDPPSSLEFSFGPFDAGALLDDTPAEPAPAAPAAPPPPEPEPDSPAAPRTKGPRPYDATQSYYERVETLTTMIQDTVGTQAEWAAYGGEVGSLKEFEGKLIIKTTPANHRQIERLLASLRR